MKMYIQSGIRLFTGIVSPNKYQYRILLLIIYHYAGEQILSRGDSQALNSSVCPETGKQTWSTRSADVTSREPCAKQSPSRRNKCTAHSCPPAWNDPADNWCEMRKERVIKNEEAQDRMGGREWEESDCLNPNAKFYGP